jgi:hypothetical protein
MDIRAALNDPKLFAPFLGGESWHAWRTVLAAMQGLPLSDEELQTFQRLTERREPPTEAAEELWAIVGRRGGKTRAAAVLAVYLAALRDLRPVLAPGERATILLLAQNQRQARVAFGYAAAVIDHVPMIARMVTGRTADTISLSNAVDLEVRAASFRGLRGLTLAGVVCDEIAYWMDSEGGSANPADAILDAVRPGLSTTGGPLVAISSPYRRSGPLWETYRRSYGQDHDRTLVVQAPSRSLNPTLPQSVVDRAIEKDPAAASAEYLAQFRDDITGFLDPTWIDAAQRETATDVAPREGVRYRAFVDPSGGRSDGFTLAIGHVEHGRRVIDAVRRAAPPFDPQIVVAKFAEVAKSYRCHTVYGDRYSAEFVVSAFRDHGITYRPSEKPKSDIYLEVEPVFAQGAAEIPPDKRLLTELRNLERRTTRSGRDQVDHPRGGSDDLANAVAGALWLLRPPSKRERPKLAPPGGDKQSNWAGGPGEQSFYYQAKHI